MDIKSAEAFKDYAYQKFCKVVRTNETNPIDFLYSLDWNVPMGPAFDEIEVAHMNLKLDESGCFGRIVKTAVLAETYFPKETFHLGEVCNDFFRNLLIAGGTAENWNDETYLAEILQYEDPHAVLVWNG